MKNKRLYVAYGSNLNREQMAVRCPTAEVIGATTLDDWKLVFRGSHDSAVANIEPSNGTSVPALVWSIQPDDEAALDRYEGCPTLYRKETIPIVLDGKPTNAMIYIMNVRYPLGRPNCWYYTTIRKGYQDAGFDVRQLQAATECA